MSAGVVMVSPNFHPYVGGAEKQALELSKALCGSGLEVTVLTRRVLGLPAREVIGGVRIWRLPVLRMGLLDPLSFMAGVFAWLVLSSQTWRVVHVHLAGSPAVAAALAARILGRQAIVKVGGGRGIGELAVSSGTPSGRLKLGVLEMLAPLFVSVTGDLVEELREHGLGQAPVAVVPNGVDTEAYVPAPAAGKASARAGLGWPASGLAFLFVGGWRPRSASTPSSRSSSPRCARRAPTRSS